MGTRRRRRIDAVLLGRPWCWSAGPPSPGRWPRRTERITGLWAGAQVAAGGAARIVEVIDYDFGSRERHGIFRDVPGLDPADPVQVASPSAPAQVEVTGTAHQTRLRIGDPERTVRGRHRYTIGYRLAGVAPGGRLAWDAVGTSWPVGIARAELHVAAPYRLEDARCVQGGAGSRTPCRVAQPEPGHLVATVEEPGRRRGRDPVRHRRDPAGGRPRPARPAGPTGQPRHRAGPAGPGGGRRRRGGGRRHLLARPPRRPRAGRSRRRRRGRLRRAWDGRLRDPGGHGGPGPAGHRRVRAAEGADAGPGRACCWPRRSTRSTRWPG